MLKCTVKGVLPAAVHFYMLATELKQICNLLCMKNCRFGIVLLKKRYIIYIGLRAVVADGYIAGLPQGHK